MPIGILNNIASLSAENQLSVTNSSLQSTLYQLSSGSRINSGADDAAGLAIANGLQANITALSQSARNANDGVGMLQVADGALAQVTTLLNRAVTLATESATGTVGSSQRVALNAEYTAIQNEIDRIGNTTTYNGMQVFNGGSQNIFLSDSNLSSSITVNPINLTAAGLVNAAGQSVSISAAVNPTAGDTILIGNTTYTFVDGSNANTAATTTMQVADQTGATAETAAVGGAVKVLIDSNSNDSAATQIANTLANLAAAVNGGPGAGTVYQAGGNANLNVTGTSSGMNATFSATAAGLALAPGSAALDASNNIAITPTITAGGGGQTWSLVGANVAGTGFLANANAATDLLSAASAKTALTAINAAIQTIAADRGALGAVVNRLQSASNVITNQVQNLTSAENGITAADIPSAVANLTKYSILEQTGISSLAQANQQQQLVLKLLQ
ncbi:MAG TPA: flagellin [Dongiaceae bacterium]|nr:flagellin [Dongiaceae bacterium]